MSVSLFCFSFATNTLTVKLNQVVPNALQKRAATLWPFQEPQVLCFRLGTFQQNEQREGDNG